MWFQCGGGSNAALVGVLAGGDLVGNFVGGPSLLVRRTGASVIIGGAFGGGGRKSIGGTLGGGGFPTGLGSELELALPGWFVR